MWRALGREAARACFVLALLLAGVAAWLAALLAPVLGAERGRAATRAACKLAWTPALRLLPWVSLGATPSAAEWDAFAASAASGAGAVLLLNHASPMDPLAFVALCPWRVMVHLPLRVLVHAAHFRLPLFGRVCRAAGHFPVYLVPRAAAPGRRVDRALQAGVMADVAHHVAHGGVLVVFPEGRCAPPGAAHTLAPFHTGAFAVALAAGAPLWALLQVGTDAFAPPDAVAGGFPARLSARLLQLRARSPPLTAAAALPARAAREPEAVLAEECRAAMQRALDDLLAAKGEGAPGEHATQPLLQC